MTGTEFLLLVCLFAAVGYILWLEKQPKTDRERDAEEFRRERLARVDEAHREKMAKKKGVHR
jgi:uncharacterized membrane protein